MMRGIRTKIITVKRMVAVFLSFAMALSYLSIPVLAETDTAKEVFIGNEEEYIKTDTLPVNMYYNYSLNQQIFLADEIETAGIIDSLSFYYTYDEPFSMDGVQIYLAHTTKGEFDNDSDMVPLTNATLVYDGSFAATGSGWVKIDLMTPFTYNGKDNLLLCVYDPTDGCLSSSFKFQTAGQEKNLALLYYSDYQKPDLNNINAYYGNKSRNKYRNNLKIGFSKTGPVPVDSIHLSSDRVKTYVGRTKKITAKLFPENNTENAVVWSVQQDDQVVKLYADAACTTEVGSDPTDKFTVYIKANKAGTALLRASSTGENVVNKTCEITVDETKDVYIGDRSSEDKIDCLPFDGFYYYSLSQQIYLASEIGKSGVIHYLSFEYVEGAYINKTIEIYMGHTEKNSFSGIKDWGTGDLNLVYRGKIEADSKGEIPITLDTPFSYNGRENLLVCVRDYSGTDANDWVYFKSTKTGENALSIYHRAVYNEVAISDLPNTDGTVLKERSNILIGFDEKPDVALEDMSLTPSKVRRAYLNEVIPVRVDLNPWNAGDRTVVWKVEQAGQQIKLYEDEDCTEEIGPDATGTLTVYAKCLAPGDAVVTVTSYENNDINASCGITVSKADINGLDASPDKLLSKPGTAVPVTVKKADGNASEDAVIWSVEQEENVVKLYKDKACENELHLGRATDLKQIYVKTLCIGHALIKAESTDGKTAPICIPVIATEEAGDALVTLEAHKVWDDGTGYQMLLDQDANTYGDIIPETGGLNGEGDADPEIYEAFEYKIPEGADGAQDTNNVLVDGDISIRVPAGIYDYCITNPTPYDRIWIAGNGLDKASRADDFAFLPVYHYTFRAERDGDNDGVVLDYDKPVMLDQDDCKVRIDDVVPITASLDEAFLSDNRQVIWKLCQIKGDLKLYTDEECTNPVTSGQPTDVLTVYAKAEEACDTIISVFSEKNDACMDSCAFQAKSSYTAGCLSIKKNVAVNGAPTTGTLADGSYTFHITGTKGQTIPDAKVTIKNGSSATVTIDGLIPDTYTITEDTEDLPEGMTSKADSEGESASVLGGNKVSAIVTAGNDFAKPIAAFTNDLPVLYGQISGKVTLTGRDFTKDDAFTLTLSAENGTPMPEKTTVTVTKDSKGHTESFGDIPFTAPGTYTYTISQTHKGETIAGLDYEDSDRTVIMKVKRDDQGRPVADGTQMACTASFENVQRAAITRTATFRVENGSWNDGSRADKTVSMNGYEGDSLTLPASAIPSAGSKPDEGYQPAGSWDQVPEVGSVITNDVTYLYTYKEKEKPKLSVPEGLVAYYGQTLSDVSLEDYPGWAWDDSKLSVGDAGNRTFLATFTPEDTDTYLVAENVAVPLTVERIDYPGSKKVTDFVWSDHVTQNATLTLPALPEGAAYAKAGTVSGNEALISDHSVSGNTLTYSTAEQPAQTSATILIGVSGAKNYKDYTVEAVITTKDKENANLSISGGDRTVTYGDEAFTLSAEVQNPGNTQSSVLQWSSGTSSVAQIDEESGTVTILKAGTAVITAFYESDTTMGKASITLTVGKLTIDPVVTISGEYAYTGESIYPDAEQVEVTLDDTVIESSEYDLTYGENIGPGEGSVTVRSKEDSNYLFEKTATFTITKKDENSGQQGGEGGGDEGGGEGQQGGQQKPEPKPGVADQDGGQQGGGSNPNAKPGEKQQEPAPAKAGTDLTSAEHKAVFTVLSGSGEREKPSVSYKGCTDKRIKSIEVPETVTIGGITYEVTEISDSAFAGCKAVTKIVIPKSVKKIGNNVFKGLKKLKSIIVKTTKLTKKTVAKKAFKGVDKKVKIKVPKSKKKAYKTLFRSKGLSKKVKVK